MTNAWLKTFTEFIAASPTSFHAAVNAGEMLTAAGFTQLDETQTWSNVSGKHFIIRDGAVVAWVAPSRADDKTGLAIMGAHTDSPALKLKPGITFESSGYTMVDVEVYGGPKLTTWFDRELALAGRIVDNDGKTYLVNTDPILRMSTLAPHLDRASSDELKVDRQADLQPLFSADKQNLADYLWRLAGLEASQIGGFDLFVVPSEKPQIFGIQDEFLASYRLDNLASTFPGLMAILDAEQSKNVLVFAAFDHEEVGSGTASGACGTLLSDVLGRISAALGQDEQQYRAWIQRGSCLSADVAHALNVTKQDHYDPHNYPVLNGGPALKLSAQARYGTDAVGAAIWQRTCRQAGVESQCFVNRNNIRGGTSIGPLVATGLGIRTLDVGIGIYSMHSAREMCGTKDLVALYEVINAYFRGI